MTTRILAGMAVAALCWLPLGAVAQDRVAKAGALIDSLVSEITMFQASDSENPMERRSEISRVLHDYFDVKRITSFSAGRYWRSATDDEKEQYAALMSGALCETIYNNFDNLQGLVYMSGKATAKGERFVIVSGTLHDEGGSRPPVSLNWRVLTLEGSEPRIFDIEVENLSLLVTQKQENEAVVRKNKGRFSALIDAMRERVTNSEGEGCH